MEIKLYRTYFPEGTNGELYHLGELVCYTIELPWRENETNVSCIPEGRYRLARRLNSRLAMHRLTGLVYEAAKREPVYITIKTKNV